MRLAETTLALLERRHLALKHGITLPTVPTPATAIPAADKDAIAALESDIAERRRVIADTQKDADQYSGGLIKVTLLQRLVTEQTTLAALEQGLLSLNHGLPPAPGLTRVASIAVAPEVPAPLDADIAATRAFRPRKDTDTTFKPSIHLPAVALGFLHDEQATRPRTGQLSRIRQWPASPPLITLTAIMQAFSCTY
jgi:hypothetical protein